MKTLLVLTLASAFLTFAPRPPQDKGSQAQGLEVGSPAPEFRLNDENGKAQSLKPIADGQWTVVAFYPKASTPGCTREACSLRDASADLTGLKARVFYVSLDDVVSIKAFSDAQKANFRMLSDPDGSVATKYGVLKEGSQWANRVTFVIDPKGVIKYIERQVKVDSHGKDLSEILKKLQA